VAGRSSWARLVGLLFADVNPSRAVATNHRMAVEPEEITMSRLKSALVAAIGTVAIAGFATALAGQAAMAAGSQRTMGPLGSVRFTVDSAAHRSVSQGSRMSAGQNKQGLLVPAVQTIRCASRRC
jgi:hypothetical protein